MSIYIITGVVSLLAVLGLLFYWLKKRKKSNHSTKYGGDMAEYGIEVEGINLFKNKILGLYQIHVLENGKSYNINLPPNAYYSIVDEFSTVAISSNWNNRYKDERSEGFHKINVNNGVIEIRWVTQINVHPFLPKIIFIWR